MNFKNLTTRVIKVYSDKGFIYLVSKAIRMAWARIIIKSFISTPGKAKKAELIKTEINNAMGHYKASDSEIASKKVSVIICVHNAPDDTRKCLESVLRYRENIHELIIVDDGSEQETQEILQKFAGKHKFSKLLRHETALRYTKAANAGMQISSGDFVILLNSDTIVTKGWVRKILSCALSDKKIGIVGPLSNVASWQSVPEFEHEGDWAHNEIPDGYTLDTWAETITKFSRKMYPYMPFLNGFCFCIKREVIDSIGYFDEEAFPEGYGEENDYCLRARKAGWSLCVADDTYIFHGESKSYSHDKRRELSTKSGSVLLKKHGQDSDIVGDDRYCRAANSLTSMRNYIKILPEIAKITANAHETFKGKKILIILPVGVVGGGANVVLAEAAAMREMGVEVKICNLDQNKKTFLDSYAKDSFDDVTFIKKAHEIGEVSKDYDAVISTAHHSVRWLKYLSEDLGQVRGYYIQDYEPLFYDSESMKEKAKETYSLFDDIKIFTKTQWNRDIVLSETGQSASLVGSSFSLRDFFPVDDYYLDNKIDKNDIVITAMVRPSSERRAPQETMKVLKEIKEKYTKKVTIIIFGSTTEEIIAAKCTTNFDFINIGVTDPKTLRSIFTLTDIFLDCSEYQAMGLTAMEAMACGTAVIIPQEGGVSSYAKQGDNALIVDTKSHSAIIQSLSELIENRDVREKIAQSALRGIMEYNEYKAAKKILETLFSSEK